MSSPAPGEGMVGDDRSRPAILIADDDPVFAALAAACLGRIGYGTAYAADGEEALHLLDGQEFCAALVDLDMPRIDGFRLIALVRARRELDRLAIVVTTSSHRRSDHGEALALGADAVEVKPIDWTRIKASVDGVIMRRRGILDDRGGSGSASRAD